MKITNEKTAFRANKISKVQANYINDILLDSKNVDIICHNSTDRDCANSAAAMWQYLESKGVSSRIIISQKNLNKLNLDLKDLNIVQADDIEEVEKVIPESILCVDFSSKEKIKPNIYEHIKKSENILGLDHHVGYDLTKEGNVELKKSYYDKAPNTQEPYYSDTTAKSATSVIYRFFEALEEDIDNKTTYELFFGLVDDCTKGGLIKCNGASGEIVPGENFKENKNAFEVYNKLKNSLDKEQIAQIAKSIDILSSLNEDEQRLKDSLEERLSFSDNHKIAYVEIAPDDELWVKAGRDNPTTSTILNRFRQETLTKEDVNTVIVFYEANGSYRLSSHTKDNSLLDFFDYIKETKLPDMTCGGHRSRGGGSIKTTDKEACHKWAQTIISCADFYD